MARECLHMFPYRYAVRVRGGVVTFKKIAMGKSVNVVATWCERCGMISVGGADTRYLPRARVIEDLL